ncbi:MAG: SufE family protein [Bacteroidetes bacterium]|nr:SufE family protein [Bacteroidota bacterium]
MTMEKDILEIETDFIESFSFLDTWEEKYEYIIELGKKLPPLEVQYKTEDRKIKGCQSTVWLAPFYNDGKVFFKADSDAMIVKGLISMLIAVLSGHSPDMIINASLDFIEKIGMHAHLAQTRSNGLRAMVKQMKDYAMAYKEMHEQENH